MTSRELLAGPIVATIFVRRILPIKQVRRENSSRNVLLSVGTSGDYHRQGPLLVCQSGQYRSLERHVTKKSHISPLTRAGTVSLFAGADTVKLLCSHPLSRASAVAAAELSALVAKSPLASGTFSGSWPEFRLAESWDGRCEGGDLIGVCYPFEDRRLKLGRGIRRSAARNFLCCHRTPSANMLTNAPANSRSARFALFLRDGSLPRVEAGSAFASHDFGTCSVFIRHYGLLAR